MVDALMRCLVVLCSSRKKRRTFHKIRVEQPLANGEQRLKVKKLREQQKQAAVHTFGEYGRPESSTLFNCKWDFLALMNAV